MRIHFETALQFKCNVCSLGSQLYDDLPRWGDDVAKHYRPIRSVSGAV